MSLDITDSFTLSFLKDLGRSSIPRGLRLNVAFANPSPSEGFLPFPLGSSTPGLPVCLGPSIITGTTEPPCLGDSVSPSSLSAGRLPLACSSFMSSSSALD